MTDKKIKKDNQFFCTNRVRNRNPHNDCENYSSEFNDERFICENSKYSTLDLIEDLKRELQKYSEILSRIFPNRYIYSHKKLSLFWRRGKNINYVSKLKAKTENEENFSLDEKDLNLLEEQLRSKFGNQASNCFYIIEQYKESKISLKIFIELIELELGKISGDVKLTYGELAIILGKHEDYIYHIRKYILSQTNRRYNPNYKFDLETLEEFKEALRMLLKEKSKISISYIEKYIYLNPDLKEYLFERVTIENPHYFESINTKVKLYWFGFIFADALIKKKYRYTFKFELNSLDRERLVKLADLIGLDTERIKDREKIYHDANGNLKIKEYSYIQFKSKRMIEDLLRNGYSSSVMGAGLPEIIKRANEDMALIFLLGFFDGDGTWYGGRSAEIYSSNKMILMDIKKKFKIKYPIRTTKEPVIDKLSGKTIHRAAHRLTLGADLYEKMMINYAYSMKRKRAPQFRGI